MATVDLLEVAKTLDPRFAQNMPQEVADAFANGEIVRIFRTGKFIAPKATDPSNRNFMGFTPDPHGEYTGSIYAVRKDGSVTRFKNPEIASEHAMMGSSTSDAGWNAKTRGKPGESPFFNRAHVFEMGEGTPGEQALFDTQRAGIHSTQTGRQILHLLENEPRVAGSFTPIMGDPRELMGGVGRAIIESDIPSPGQSATVLANHLGDEITDIYDITGERYYFSADMTANAGRGARGGVVQETVDTFMSRKKSGPAPVVPVPPTPKPTPTKPKTPAPKPPVKPTPPKPKPKPTPKIKPGKILPSPGSPGGVVITPIPTPTPTPKPAPIPSSKSTKITPKVTPRRYPKPTPMRYDSDKLNKLRPLPKYKDVLVAGITASPGSSPAAVATAAATTPAGSSIAFRDLIKNKAKAISGSSVIKKYQNITNTKLTMGGIAAAGLATSIAVSKNRLSEKEKRR